MISDEGGHDRPAGSAPRLLPDAVAMTAAVRSGISSCFRLEGATEAELSDIAGAISGAIAEASGPISSEAVTALRDIVAERSRQIAKGYVGSHDDKHDRHEIAHAAASLAIDRPDNWPWVLRKWPDCGRRAQLVVAAALMIAEIERLDRLFGYLSSDVDSY